MHARERYEASLGRMDRVGMEIQFGTSEINDMYTDA